jgi:two-component system, LytTR family, sensor kinase
MSLTENSKSPIWAFLQLRIVQHLGFWVLASVVCFRIFAYSPETRNSDFLYTFLFLNSAAAVVYLNQWAIRLWLAKEAYWVYTFAAMCILGLGLALHYAIFNYLPSWLFPDFYFISYYRPFEILSFMLAFWAISTLLKLSKAWFRELEQKQAMQKLEQAKTKAELSALKAQLDPHFLFNNLNSIYSLALEEDPRTAEAVLKLSENLRYVLYDSGDAEASLSAEVKHLENYFQLQHWRFGGLLDTRVEINGKLDDLNLPPLLWLPLLENAFKYVGKNELGAFFVSCKLDTAPDRLYFALHNSLPAGKTPKSEVGGIGLSNLRRRLELLYPGAHHFNLVQTEKELVAILELKLKTP